MDLECSGGGSFQYGCGNMGISSGCGDIYDASLDCQWIDVTNVPAGDYTLVVRVNWDRSPDALGRVLWLAAVRRMAGHSDLRGRHSDHRLGALYRVPRSARGRI